MLPPLLFVNKKVRTEALAMYLQVNTFKFSFRDGGDSADAFDRFLKRTNTYQHIQSLSVSGPTISCPFDFEILHDGNWNYWGERFEMRMEQLVRGVPAQFALAKKCPNLRYLELRRNLEDISKFRATTHQPVHSKQLIAISEFLSLKKIFLAPEDDKGFASDGKATNATEGFHTLKLWLEARIGKRVLMNYTAIAGISSG
jgi:hypothetical protein